MVEVLGKESAKAIGKVADASGKAIDAGREFGGFFSRHFGGSIEQWAGLWEDKLKYRRWENQLALMLKAEEKIKALGLEGRLRPLDMKTGIPLLEAASLESEDSMRELWANLLVNAVNPDFHSPIRPVFVHALQHMTPSDAYLLDSIHKRFRDLDEERIKSHVKQTLHWNAAGIAFQSTIGPDRTELLQIIENEPDEEKRAKLIEDQARKDFKERQKKNFSRGIAPTTLNGFFKDRPEELNISLASLASLGCVSVDHQHHDNVGEYTRYGLTPLGKALIEAITLENENGSN